MIGPQDPNAKKRASNGLPVDSLKRRRPRASEPGPADGILKDSPLPPEFQELFLRVVLQHGLQTASPKLLVRYSESSLCW